MFAHTTYLATYKYKFIGIDVGNFILQDPYKYIKVSSPQGDITFVAKANSRSNSLRTTIPVSIVRQFGFKEGDRLIWKIEADNNQLIIKIKPLE